MNKYLLLLFTSFKKKEKGYFSYRVFELAVNSSLFSSSPNAFSVAFFTAYSKSLSHRTTKLYFQKKMHLEKLDLEKSHLQKSHVEKGGVQ